jgi:hypothetical protein
MAPHTKLLLLLTACLALPLSASAQNRNGSSALSRHGIVLGSNATSADLARLRPRGFFYTETDQTLDYNSYSYDDRYHGPPLSYNSRRDEPRYYYAPGYPMVRYSTGGPLYYWPRTQR